MARAPGTEFHEKLSDVTECSICAEIFTNPKFLPCVHTFCLHCLEKYGEDKNPGDQMACPLCRSEFTIPQEGFSNLPNNFFIGKIVEIGKLATVPEKEEVCELCSEETAVAKKFCIDCQQKLCDRCNKSHSRIKQCQNHQVVELGSQLNVKELNFRDSYCEHHPKELIKMFCHEDNVAICLICCVESHQSHKCSNVEKASAQFTEQLKDDLRKVANRRPECEEAFQKLEKFKTEFHDEILKTEENIRRPGAELKKLIDQHIEMSIQKLKVVRDRNLKCFEITKQDVGRFKVMIDSYQRYCNELLARGSPVDICRAASQMHTRANDLEKQPVNCGVDEFYCDQISFHSANLEILMKQNRINNVVGELRVTKSTDRIVRFQKGILVSCPKETACFADQAFKGPAQNQDVASINQEASVFRFVDQTFKGPSQNKESTSTSQKGSTFRFDDRTFKGPAQDQDAASTNLKDGTEVNFIVNKVIDIPQDQKSIAKLNPEQMKILTHWEYDDGTAFVKYSDEINAIIEKAFTEGKSHAEWKVENAKYRLTFSTMVEDCLTKWGIPPVKVRRVKGEDECRIA